MGDVIPLKVITRLDLPTERVIEALKDVDLDAIVVVGHLKDGRFYFASNKADGAEVLWFLESAKFKLMKITDD